MQKKITLTLIILAGLSANCSALAAKPVDLAEHPVSAVTSLLTAANHLKRDTQPVEKLEERNRAVDANQTTHVRMQETFAGVPVWGADSVMHIKRDNQTLRSSAPGSDTTVNGMMYQELGNDLLINPEQARANEARAVMTAVSLSHHSYQTAGMPNAKTSKFVIYVDNANKAHYAFFIQLFYHATLSTPSYILDAMTFQTYKTWNDTKRVESLSEVSGGAFGGNQNTGKLIYDGMSEHLAKLSIQRDAEKKICYLENAEVVVKDARSNDIAKFNCDLPSKEHNNVYWAGDFDTVNGGYSPASDALYAGSVAKEMYLKRYNIEVLVKDKNPMQLEMLAHSRDLEDPDATNNNWENAVWYQSKIYLGDGGSNLYPLTSLSIITHEIGHGFTDQHSNLIYEGQSGGLNEAFSDMSAQAAEYYATGKNSWVLGPEVSKNKQILRNMQSPSSDGRSIDNAKNYNAEMNVHYSSGVFNRLFYLLSQKWGVEKTFAVMLQANAYYWISASNFRQAACDVSSVVKNFKYDEDVLNEALKEVGLEEPCLLDLEKPILDHAKVDIVLNDPQDLCDSHHGAGMQLTYSVQTTIGRMLYISGDLQTPALMDQQSYSLPTLSRDKLVYKKFEIAERGGFCGATEHVYYEKDHGNCDNENLVTQFHSRNIKIIVTPEITHGWLGDNYKLNCEVQ